MLDTFRTIAPEYLFRLTVGGGVTRVSGRLLSVAKSASRELYLSRVITGLENVV